MPLYSYVCSKCKEEGESFVSFSKREEAWDCESCGEKEGMKYTIAAPKVLDSGSATLLDGTKRAGWDEMRKISQIRKEAVNLPREKRQKHREEVRKLRGKVDF